MAETTSKTEIRPQEGPQEQFLSTSADVAFYGGAAGGGKTYGLLLEPLRYIDRVKGFGGVIFRRVGTQITNEGGLWDDSMELYPQVGGVPRQHLNEWIFPPYGNRIKFAHMQYVHNRLDWQGAQIPFIGWDEGTHFARKQVMYMFSRNRSTCGIKPYIRLTYNPVPPDDKVGGWIHEFVGWYLDEEGYPRPDRSGVIRYFVNTGDELRWFDTREAAGEFAVGIGLPRTTPKSFTYILSTVYDNKILLEKDPGYEANLHQLPHVERERLLRANHFVKEEAGKVFNRSDFVVVEAAPRYFLALVRFWDFAATKKKMEKQAATASVLMGVDKAGTLWVLDVTEDWVGPGELNRLVLNTARRDGGWVAVRWEEEGGSAGKRSSFTLVKDLRGYDAKGIRPTGDKLERSKPLAAQVAIQNVMVLRSHWTQGFLDHMHAIPDGARWDIHDAAAGSFNELMLMETSGVISEQEEVLISPY